MGIEQDTMCTNAICPSCRLTEVLPYEGMCSQCLDHLVNQFTNTEPGNDVSRLIAECTLKQATDDLLEVLTVVRAYQDFTTNPYFTFVEDKLILAIDAIERVSSTY